MDVEPGGEPPYTRQDSASPFLMSYSWAHRHGCGQLLGRRDGRDGRAVSVLPERTGWLWRHAHATQNNTDQKKEKTETLQT